MIYINMNFDDLLHEFEHISERKKFMKQIWYMLCLHTKSKIRLNKSCETTSTTTTTVNRYTHSMCCCWLLHKYPHYEVFSIEHHVPNAYSTHTTDSTPAYRSYVRIHINRGGSWVDFEWIYAITCYTHHLSSVQYCQRLHLCHIMRIAFAHQFIQTNDCNHKVFYMFI